MENKVGRVSLLFFNRSADKVAKELLGKIIVRKINENEIKAQIVETEAYFDENDPASRACQNGDLRLTMRMESGTILVYGVHNNWMFNIVTDEEGKASAVLIRAVEPMNFDGKCNGPGLLTKALIIGKGFHKKNIIDNDEIWIEDNGNLQDYILKRVLEGKVSLSGGCSESRENLTLNTKKSEIVSSFRIGVKKDLPRKLRFYIKDNEFVSRR